MHYKQEKVFPYIHCVVSFYTRGNIVIKQNYTPYPHHLTSPRQPTTDNLPVLLFLLN